MVNKFHGNPMTDITTGVGSVRFAHILDDNLIHWIGWLIFLSGAYKRQEVEMYQCTLLESKEENENYSHARY